MSDGQTTDDPDEVPVVEEAAAEAVPEPAAEAVEAPVAEEAPAAQAEPVPAPEPAPAADAGWAPPAEPTPGWDAALSGSGGEALAEKPEVLVGAAFAGGVVLALILKRLAR